MEYRLLACFVCRVLMASVLNINYLHKLQFFYTIIWVFRCSGDFRFYGGHEKPEYKRWIKTGLIWLTLKLTSFFWQNGSEEAVDMHSFWSTSSFLFVRYKRGHWIQTLIGPPHFVASDQTALYSSSHSRVTCDTERLALHSAFLNIHPRSGVYSSCCMTGATRNCCRLCVRSVYTVLV